MPSLTLCPRARNSPTGSASAPNCSAVMLRISEALKLPMSLPSGPTTASEDKPYHDRQGEDQVTEGQATEGQRGQALS